MRTLAIGDIHGCLTALRLVLEAVQPGKDDVLVTLGDYVDRGPDTKGVLDTLLELEKTTQLKPLMGNHEVLFLEAAADMLDQAAWMRIGGRETLLSYAPDQETPSWDNVTEAHLDFIANRCLRYWENATHLFVHANANAVLPLSEQSDMWLFWTRFEESFPHVSGKTLICGHTAQKAGIPTVRPQAICLDTWVYGHGWLTCMDVEAGLFVQANQAGQVKRLTFADLELLSMSLPTQPL